MLCSAPSEMGSWGSGALGRHSQSSNSLWTAGGGGKASLTQGQHCWCSARHPRECSFQQASGTAETRCSQDLQVHSPSKRAGGASPLQILSPRSKSVFLPFVSFTCMTWDLSPALPKCSQLRCCESRSDYNLTPSHSYRGSGVIFKRECYIHLSLPVPEVNTLPWLSTENAAVNAPSAGKQEVRKQNESKQCFS